MLPSGEGGWRYVGLLRFSQDPHSAISQTTAFFIVTAMKTSNPTKIFCPWYKGPSCNTTIKQISSHSLLVRR
jgi:hypothetical protein